MPAILQAFGVWFSGAIGGMVARALGSIGIGVVSYIGVTTVIQQVIDLIHSHLGAASNVLHLAGLAGLDVFASLVISAYAGVVAWGIAVGGMKRLSFLQGAGGAGGA
ncbi:DUF2523 domain-containing protein [Alcanivorax sp. MM125-6]|nr:DUF2523 domain-containing protein [Alcanivorax sp. MM125-6]